MSVMTKKDEREFIRDDADHLIQRLQDVVGKIKENVDSDLDNSETVCLNVLRMLSAHLWIEDGSGWEENIAKKIEHLADYAAYTHHQKF